MAYQENKPQSTDAPSVSQSDLLGNFQAIKTLIDVNHATFGSATEGKHPIVHFPMLTVISGSVPAATTTTEYALYSTTAGLWVRPPNKTAGTVTSDINFIDDLKATSGWCRLPCGTLMQWGIAGMGKGVYNATGAYPNTVGFATSKFYSITCSVKGDIIGSHEDNVVGADGTATAWTVYRKHAGSAISVNWFAIGA